MTSFEVRLFDFTFYDKEQDDGNDPYDNDDMSEDTPRFKDLKQFRIQAFGLDEVGNNYSLTIQDVEPFFFAKVNGKWKNNHIPAFKQWLIEMVGGYYSEAINVDLKLHHHHKLYGFDAGKEHSFLKITCASLMAFNKVKKLWYDIKTGKTYVKRLKKGGLHYPGSPGAPHEKYIEIYESNIPPLLRYFHIHDISPSGWVKVNGRPKKQSLETYCNFEFNLLKQDIVALNDKETIVPFKICSFDIEASSSHGDFPTPVKSCLKLATDIIDAYIEYQPDDLNTMVKEMILTAFGFDGFKSFGVQPIYPKKRPSFAQLSRNIESILKMPITVEDFIQHANEYTIEDAIADSVQGNDDAQASNSFNFDIDEGPIGLSIREESEYSSRYNSGLKSKSKCKLTNSQSIGEVLTNTTFSRDEKINYTNTHITRFLPKIEGDKVTFIGSTFMRYGDAEPYKNTCIALGECDNVDGAEPIVCCDTEKKVLLEWTKLIREEDPDIIIGYNIFGFDYQFMFYRAEENYCLEDFLKLSRNRGEKEICGTVDKDGRYRMEESSIVIASGQHDLKYIKMDGRIQIDLYNYLRRDYNLSSYKLDSVSSEFIGDTVKSIEVRDGNTTAIYTKNMTGLQKGNFVNFEEVSHSSELYNDGCKYKVIYKTTPDDETPYFVIDGVATPNLTLKVRWGLVKDDVTPQDIFRMTNEGPSACSTIAKYCIQDCNLVQYLLNKIDVITGFVEMARICSVPISFLVFRGQGIKLTSYIAKKCREKNTLMPDIDKKLNDGGYEGAIVLPPKTSLYLDNPVACVDYSSLYPSSIISDNICHSSKVWTKEYDLEGNLILETGEKNARGVYIYDNLPEYEYVDIEYDTYRYERKTPTSAATKVISGKKICRWAQYKDGYAIMPSILRELLAARKATRKQIPHAKDDFMRNILDKRQLSIKVTANSLYGQTGAITSTFYEKDVAASTTAIGRKLLTYAKRVIEEVYGDSICTTKCLGDVRTRAEYIYGDTDSVFFTFNLETPTGEHIRGKPALEATIELAQEAGHLASQPLKGPHDLEYEKTFLPFCLLSKKRYVGMLYEDDPNKCYRKSMGIVLKRRDNAPIVKDVYGGIIDILMKEQNIDAAVAFLREALQKLVEEKYPIEKLIITKSLRGNYKNPKQIAHKVLADRIGERDPGNKPSVGDRIPFVYIKNENKRALQGEKIEIPGYIVENGLKPDYSHYITNQIMKPVLQVFGLVIKELPGMKGRVLKQKQFDNDIKEMINTLDRKQLSPGDRLTELNKKQESITSKYVKDLLFTKYINMAENTSTRTRTVDSFFK